MVHKIAYLGPPGTYSEEATLRYASGAQHVPFGSISAVASAVTSGQTNEGLVPIENSLEGAVTDTLDLLIRESTLFIRAELVLPISHCLLVVPGTLEKDITVIYSHPQALGQCRAFLERTFPTAQVMASLSTVSAVEEMQNSKQTAAAIAPRRAAELYESEIIAEGLQDSDVNVTRFVVLGGTDHEPTGRDKTSLCFSFEKDRPGSLYKVVGEFAERHINLVKIESRPTKEGLGSYIFLIDLDGHKEDSKVKEALEVIQKDVAMLRIFGSYPSFAQ